MKHGNFNGFDEDSVKIATLEQMRVDGMLQNAINKQELGEMTKEVSDVIFKYHCVPNCVKKHYHNYMYDYSKCYKDTIRSRPGECHDAD